MIKVFAAPSRFPYANLGGENQIDSIFILETGESVVYPQLKPIEDAADELPLLVTDVNSIVVPEGGFAELKVKLEEKPSGNVAVSSVWLDGSDADLSAPVKLSFNPGNWNVWQTVKVFAAEDADLANGSGSLLLRAELEGRDVVSVKDIAVMEKDDDCTLTVNAIGNGRVNRSGTMTLDQHDSPFALAAVPDAGYVFSGWRKVSGTPVFASANSAETTLTLSGNSVIEAVFAYSDIAAGAVAFSGADYAAKESANSVVITVKRSGGSTGACSVDYATGNGTAVAGTDYTETSGTLTWSDGDSADKTFTIALKDNNLYNANKTINLRLSGCKNVTLGSPNAAVLTILDDDPLPVVSFASAQKVTEDCGAVKVKLTLDHAYAADAAVKFTVSGTATKNLDYTISTPSPLAIPAGSTSAELVFQIIDDAITDADETIVIQFDSSSANCKISGRHTITIEDNETASVPTVFIDATSPIDLVEGQSYTLKAYRYGPVTAPIYLNFGRQSYSGFAKVADAINSLSISNPYGNQWAAGASAPISITLKANDIGISGERTITYKISDTTSGNSTVMTGTPVITVRIHDADAAVPTVPTVAFADVSQSRAESSGSAVVSVKLSAAATVDVTVPFTVSGTATKGVDYTLDVSSVTIPAGKTSADITVQIVDDKDVEDDETIILTQGTPVNAKLGDAKVYTLTIANDDQPPADNTGDVYPAGMIQFVGQSGSVVEGGRMNLVLARTGGTSGAVSVTVILADGTTTRGADYKDQTCVVRWADKDGGNKTVSLQTIDDGTVEPDETFQARITGVTGGAVIGEPDCYTVTITDNDNVVSVSENGVELKKFNASQKTVVGSSTTLVLKRLEGKKGTVSVQASFNGGKAALGTDYTITPAIVEWSDGDTSEKTMKITFLKAGLNGNVAFSAINGVFSSSGTKTLANGFKFLMMEASK